MEGHSLPVMSRSTDPPARKGTAAFRRASEHLLGFQVVGVWGEYVWMAAS
jgi:hypothetical protein